MWDLFRGEAWRFRGWTATLAGLHLIALTFLTRIEDLAQQRVFIHVAFAALYALLGVLLGLYQMGTYRKTSRWLNLLHRPLSRLRIAAALNAAGLLQLIVVVGLPLLLVAIMQQNATVRVMDLRHWMLPVSALLVASCAYLASAFCALRGPVFAIAALPLLWWLPASNAHGFGLMGVQVLVLVGFAFLLADAFRPDLSAPPRGACAIMVALPLQMGVYLLLMVLFVGVELAWIAQGSHPNSFAAPPAGGHTEVERKNPRDRMLSALTGSQHPDAPELRAQILHSEPASFPWPLPELPQRNELSNFLLLEFNDPRRNVRWVFSHDDMRLHGHGLVDGRSRGTLGHGDAQTPFPALLAPLRARTGMVGDDLLMNGGDALYQFLLEPQQVILRLRVAPGEVIAAAAKVGEHIGVLSDRALYFFDGRALREGRELLAPEARLPLPGKTGDLRNLDVIDLADGYLVAFVFSARSGSMLGIAPFQFVLRIDDAGRVETVNHRALRSDYPALFRYRAWWISPALYAVRDAALDLFAPPLPLRDTEPAPRPHSMLWLAITLSLLSLSVAAWRTSDTSLSMRARLAWIAACGFLGLPALASLWVMEPRRERGC